LCFDDIYTYYIGSAILNLGLNLRRKLVKCYFLVALRIDHFVKYIRNNLKCCAEVRTGRSVRKMDEDIRIKEKMYIVHTIN